METEPTPERTEESKPVQNSQSSRNTWIAIVIVLVGVGAAFYFLTNGTLRFGSEKVAVVGGENITRAELDERIANIRTQGGIPEQEDVNNEELSKEVLNSMVIEELLLQKAEEEGVSLSRADAQAQLEEMKELTGEEEFNASLKETGLTEDEMVDMFQRMLSIQAYLESKVPAEEIEVTDAEIRKYYESVSDSEEFDEEEFEEMKDTIAQQIKLEKQDKLIQQHIEELREESEIEILL